MDIAGIALVHALAQGAGMITDLDLSQKGMELIKFMEEFVTCIIYRLDTSFPSMAITNHHLDVENSFA
jgi:hypothetical protein